jgi:hypothetical protein
MTEHELKCWPEFFDAVKRGDKPFDVRKNDRGYQRGDVLVLRKWDPAPHNGSHYVKPDGGHVTYADRADTVRLDVTYVLSGFGIESGYVCMGIKLQAESVAPLPTTDPVKVLASLGWAADEGESNGEPATFWTLNDEDGDEKTGACVSDGTAHGLDAFYDYSPAELRAFAQLAEESQP